MNIPLHEFEQFIDEKILQRGLSYFKNGAITDCVEVSTGEYEAIVSGTEAYQVQLSINKNIVVAHECDCPYDMGPVCKHVVAVIFYLQQDELELAAPQPKKPKKKKAKSIPQQIKELLKNISHQELVEFVQATSKKDKKFRSHFLASFGYLNQNQSKEGYQQQIRSTLKAAAGRGGWVDRSDMRQVANTLQSLLEQAEKQLTNKNFEQVFFISAAFLEEMMAATQYADDSNGDLGYFIASARDMLSSLEEEKLSDELRQSIFDYGVACFNQKIFEGWDLHLELLELASGFVTTEKEAEILLACVETVTHKYWQDSAQVVKLDLLKRFKGKKEVEQFTQEHLSNYAIRTVALEEAFEKKDFQKVITLAEDGIQYDQKERSGLVKKWRNWLLKVAEAEGQQPKIIEYARLLLLDSGHERDYYQLLKDTVQQEEWPSFLEQLIQEIDAKGHWYSRSLVRQIYIREEWWDKLFLWLKKDPSLTQIEEEEAYLSKDYAPELVNLYSQQLVPYVDNYVGRNYYQNACRYLRRMKKLGGGDKAEELIALFREKYPRRRALMEELRMV